ncbi:hypothetical protein IAT40_000852 [Kwoniella sp. CBS 6097]
MPSRQTTIFSHFSPSNRTRRNANTRTRPRSGVDDSQESAEAGPSRRPSGTRARRGRTRKVSESESEGSDALDHIRLSPGSGSGSKSRSAARPKRLAVEIPLTQRQALKKTIQDSSESDANENEEGEDSGQDDDENDNMDEKGEDDNNGVEEEVIEEESSQRPTRARNGGKAGTAGAGAVAGSSSRLNPNSRKRKDVEQVDKIDEDDITLYPSPLSPKQDRTRIRPTRKPAQHQSRDGTNSRAAGSQGSSAASVIVVDQDEDDEIQSSAKQVKRRGTRGRPPAAAKGGKGKGKAKAKADEDDDEDEIIPIDPPRPSRTQRSRPTPARARGLTQSSKSTQTKSRGLQFRRTTSELEIELPRLSQEERSKYRAWTPSEQKSKTRNVITKRLPVIEERQPTITENDEMTAVAKASNRQSPVVYDLVELDQPGHRRRSQSRASEDRRWGDGALQGMEGNGTIEASRRLRLTSLLSSVPREQQPTPAIPRQAGAGAPDVTQAAQGSSAQQVSADGPASSDSELQPRQVPLGPVVNDGEADLIDEDLDFPASGSNMPSPEKPAATAESSRPISSPPDLPSSPKPKVTIRTPSPPASNASSDFFISSRRRDKGKGKQRALPETQISNNLTSPPPKKRSKPTPLSARSVSSVSKSVAKGKQVERSEKTKKKASTGKLKSKTVDPDDDLVETEDEKDMVEHLKMDEPERFKSATRLRQKKESDFQRKLRKMKAQRLGKTISDSESEAGTEGDESTSDSAISVDNGDSFIVPDDNLNSAHVKLPHYFSIDSAQTPEFKFKVVFHYLVLLVTKKHKAFPLTPDASEYFKPQLNYWRDRMLGFRNFRVRSQIWRSNFVKAMEKYPGFEVEVLPHAVSGCDACHMSGRRSKFKIRLDGTPYNKETHEELDESSDDSESDSHLNSNNSDESDDDREVEADKLPRKLVMGRFCRARAEVFHQLVHWEDELYHAIKRYYHDLLRAKYKRIESDSEASSSSNDPDSDPEEVRQRREKRVKRKENTAARVAKIRRKGDLPKDVKDVDKVTEWMDRMGYQNKEFRWIQQLEDRSGQLEHDKRGDD